MEQIIKTDKGEALKEAKTLAKTNSYVVVILSAGKYYIEVEATMIRAWETVIAEFENGVQVKKTV
jgi:hypothetical protein